MASSSSYSFSLQCILGGQLDDFCTLGSFCSEVDTGLLDLHLDAPAWQGGYRPGGGHELRRQRGLENVLPPKSLGFRTLSLID